VNCSSARRIDSKFLRWPSRAPAGGGAAGSQPWQDLCCASPGAPSAL
jgi:hypothetical protein